MKILVKTRQVVLEHHDRSKNENHLNRVAKAHRLAPNSVSEWMWPNFFFHYSGVIKPTQNFWVVVTFKGGIEQQLVAG